VSDAPFRSLARAASALYPARERFARRFAYGKLKGDPVFAHILHEALIPKAARILDLGSGQGLLAALLIAARVEPPSYVGIELMAPDVARARAACETEPGQRFHFIEGDIRTVEFPHSDAVVILDVLHYIDYAEQADVLQRVRAALSGGGVLLLRVGDEAPSLRFRYTVFIDRLVMALRGHTLSRLYCRPLKRWIAELEKLGFRVESRPMSQGTAFANVLLVARYHSPD
jgi:SAM-dependent methyltransferase